MKSAGKPRFFRFVGYTGARFNSLLAPIDDSFIFISNYHAMHDDACIHDIIDTKFVEETCIIVVSCVRNTAYRSPTCPAQAPHRRRWDSFQVDRKIKRKIEVIGMKG